VQLHDLGTGRASALLVPQVLVRWGRYECQWEVDGSTFTWSMSDCTGTNCYGG
jgi:hypothetical protein